MLARQLLLQQFSVIQERQFCPPSRKTCLYFTELKTLFLTCFFFPQCCSLLTLHCFKVCDIFLVCGHSLTHIFFINFFNANSNWETMQITLLLSGFTIFSFTVFTQYIRLWLILTSVKDQALRKATRERECLGQGKILWQPFRSRPNTQLKLCVTPL